MAKPLVEPEAMPPMFQGQIRDAGSPDDPRCGQSGQAHGGGMVDDGGNGRRAGFRPVTVGGIAPFDRRVGDAGEPDRRSFRCERA